ncbi:uncharacterized protein BDZ83DRAFT_790787 [Colletotrichum acutatum]|uniref:Uncharacterized protein n=1 Tax=Glomerella acutata TaxID=27357 RepID=A0AAD8XJP6_GLOAC|nr:uncharacterized protein BDZ83DRAFT_790787 [Colletotrichum acutatum]KAK1727110.1 hypothetical protein BDZ83DRAFT_790787 [Colletotrichum acutatum]
MVSAKDVWPEVVTINSYSRPNIGDTQASTELEAENRNVDSPSSPSISHEKDIQDAKEYYKVFIKKIRQGQNAGLIDKSVTVGPDGHLTWPGLGNQPGTTPSLPGEINIQKLIAEYDAADADPKCARELKTRINIYDEDLGKAQKTGDMHADQLIASCAELLGVDVTTDDDGNVDKSSDDAIAAIRTANRELANVLTTFTWLITHIGRDGTEPVFKLTMKLKCKSRCFYGNRLTLFGAHMQGQPLDEKAKERWARLLGEPYRGGDDGGR